MTWRKSSFCDSLDCVEVAVTGSEVRIRQSVDAQSPVLIFTPDEWMAFLAAVKSGQFD